MLCRMPVVASTRKIAMAFDSDSIHACRVSSSNLEISREISILNPSPKSRIRKGMSFFSKRYAVSLPFLKSFRSFLEIFFSDISTLNNPSVGRATLSSRPVQYCSMGKSSPTWYASIMLKLCPVVTGRINRKVKRM